MKRPDKWRAFYGVAVARLEVVSRQGSTLDWSLWMGCMEQTPSSTLDPPGKYILSQPRGHFEIRWSQSKLARPVFLPAGVSLWTF